MSTGRGIAQKDLPTDLSAGRHNEHMQIGTKMDSPFRVETFVVVAVF